MLPQPKFRIACCLCGSLIGASADHHGLDREWKRRFPALPGSLAHEKCAVFKDEWRCHGSDNEYVPGHLLAERQPTDPCMDSRDHHNGEGTQKAMVGLMAWSGLLQGAEEYLRYIADWRARRHPAAANGLQAILARWDAPGGREFAIANSHVWTLTSNGADAPTRNP